MYAWSNMLTCKVHMCTSDVKTAIFKEHCTPLYINKYGTIIPKQKQRCFRLHLMMHSESCLS